MVLFQNGAENIVWSRRKLPFSIAAEDYGGWMLRVPKGEDPNPELNSLVKSHQGGLLVSQGKQYFKGVVGNDFSTTDFYEDVYDFYRVDDLVES